MTEWKGPWKCPSCGETWDSDPVIHLCRKGNKWGARPHDRRSPDPEKQELWNAIDNYGEHRRGCHKVYRSDRGECACGLDGLLCRIPEEKP